MCIRELERGREFERDREKEREREKERKREKERDRERQREREKEREMFLKYDASSFAYLIYAYFFIDTFFWDSPTTFFPSDCSLQMYVHIF